MYDCQVLQRRMPENHWPTHKKQCKLQAAKLREEACEIMKTVTLTLLLEYVFTLLLFAGNTSWLASPGF